MTAKIAQNTTDTSFVYLDAIDKAAKVIYNDALIVLIISRVNKNFWFLNATTKDWINMREKIPMIKHSEAIITLKQ